MRVIDKITERIEQRKPFYSFEFFPPKTDAGLRNLYARIDRMATLEPAFIDVTWGAGGSTSKRTLEIAANVQKYFGLDVLMHLTCTNMPVERLDRALDAALEAGISNILALRGDAPSGANEWSQIQGGFRFGYELVEHIRSRFGDEVCIGVAGYPEGHPESPDVDSCTGHLKQKVDAGADFVITQLFFDVDRYAAFQDRCRSHAIDCPIVPGLLPIQNYDRFRKFATFTGVHLPDRVVDELEAIKQDDARVKDYGVELCVDMCRRLQERGVPGFHFYTLNLESSVTRILEGLGVTETARTERPLPWRPSTYPGRRQEEDVRPIFWSNRPKSYLARTMDWDDFPNGRWGDRRSPAYGTLNDYYLLRRGMGAEDQTQQRRATYGEPQSETDVFEVFARFCAGEISRLPWVDGDLQAETRQISEELVRLNRNGYLTINSQPRVDGAPSAEPVVGWGGPGGVVYQKAYVELFLSPDRLERFLGAVDRYRSLTYQAVDVAGDVRTNVAPDSVTAVTWGIFPGREIIQPTVVDFQSFLIWKDEAFDIWEQEWGSIYAAESASRRVIDEIRGSYYLLNIVDNDFQAGDIWAIFREVGALDRRESPQPVGS